MQTVEFQTTVVNGIIVIPDELKEKIAGVVNVRVMPEESQNFIDVPTGEPMKPAIREIDLEAAERGMRMRRNASLNQDRIAAAAAAAFAEMGVTGQPIGAEKLQEMMIADGVDPESNEFSRGIIEMREE